MKDFLGETPEFVVDYINISSKAVLASHHVLITEDISDIKEKINQHEDIVLHGPKGCGKSFALSYSKAIHVCMWVRIHWMPVYL